MQKNDREHPGLALLFRLAAIAGALGSIAGFVFVLFPRLQPTLPEVTSTLAVSLSDLQVHIKDGRSLGRDDLAIIRFQVQTEGYKETWLPVRYTLYNADTGVEAAGVPVLGANAALSEPSATESGLRSFGRPGSPTAGFRPTARSQAFSGEIHIPLPYRGANWKVGLEITDPDGYRLAYKETQPFATEP